MKAKQKVEELEQLFKKHSIDAVDAEWIVCEVAGCDRLNLQNIELTKKMEKEISHISKQRLKHIPLAQILKKRNFYGLDFFVTKNVLIPRFETEGLCELVAKELPVSVLGSLSGLDLGTGSGAISVVLTKLFGYQMTAVDISKKALAVAKKNAKIHHVSIDFVHSNMTDRLPQKRFDFVVSNPPYILSSDLPKLEKEVVGHEPKLALDGGGDGLQFYRKIVHDAPYVLNDDGYLFFEVGKGLANEVVRLMQRDFSSIAVRKDLQGVERYVFGKLKNKRERK